MLTVLDKPKQVKEGIDEGVFYYLTKPIQETILKSVVSSAVRESKQHKLLAEELGRHRNAFKLLDNASFRVHSLDDADDVSCFIANSFPEPIKILAAIAALIVNAVEHGNIQISYDKKSELISKGSWREEVAKRLRLEENKNKFVDVVFNQEGEKYSIKITDQGKGFHWKKYIVADPARALDNHGRGVARANMLFDSIEYNKEGNQVIAIVDKTDKESFTW
ncbi:MAG: ATP-binding protein [Rickettsiaceae bacterium]